MFFMEGMRFSSDPDLSKLRLSSFWEGDLSKLCVYLFRTFTSPVKLIECLEAIRDNAFVASPYPVIITFEDHLTRDLRAKVAKVNTLIYVKCNLVSHFLVAHVPIHLFL